MPPPPGPILGLSESDWVSVVAAHGGRPTHAQAIRKALLRRGVQRLADATTPALTLPEPLVESLEAAGWRAWGSSVATQRTAGEGAVKLGVRLADDRVVECVHMGTSRSASLCVSTQVGCPIACQFCASGLGGLTRNLGVHEIVEQFAHGRRVGMFDRAVIMGIGEPMLNFTALMRALEVVVEEMPFDERRITISTVGRPRWIDRLRDHGRSFALAVSLHAADQATRDAMVPTQADVSVADVMAAAHRYADGVGGRVQCEVVVLAGVNDSDDHVEGLVELLDPTRAYVNFIPWNPVPEFDHERPSEETMHRLVRSCRDRGLFATARRTVGRAGEAACGQLRRDLAHSSPLDGAKS